MTCFYCNRPVRARALCKKHYNRWNKIFHKLREGVVKGPRAECWEWVGGGRTDHGRPRIAFGFPERERSQANYLPTIHVARALLLIQEGPTKIEEFRELQAAHACHNPLCVNRHHLFWATREQNMSGWVPDEIQVAN